jgi:agmatinase
MVVKSGRNIIGFDLCEVGVSKNDWDENVGARILYQLSAALLASQNKISYN